jgi:uridine phosphorylase
MPFPNVAGKHAYDAFFGPHENIAYRKARGQWDDFPLPSGVIFVYQRSLLDRILASGPAERRGRLIGEFYLVEGPSGFVGLSGGFGFGAPVVTGVMELLIAVGVTRFISIGAAGGIQSDLAIGDIVVCERAIRDEGVSHHYLKPARYAYPSQRLTDSLRGRLETHSDRIWVGDTWTIDAPYRETVEEVRRYQAEGVLTVEMEAAALAAVAQYRGVEFATAFAVSDSLAELTWNPQFEADETLRGLDILYDAAGAAFLDD